MHSSSVTSNALYDGPPIPDEEILSVYVIINGPLKMTAGKIAAQTFHAGRRVQFLLEDNPLGWDWLDQGKRVVIRNAETPHVFQRVKEECDILWSQFDEGLTQVDRGSLTCVVTMPYLRSEVPQILRHKRCQLL